MNFKPLITVAVLSLALPLSALAQAAASAPLPSSPAKKALVAKIMQIQRPAIESFARLVVEQPVAQMMQQAGMALQRIAPERREAVGQDIQADARKYVEENLPPVRERALKLAPSTIGTMLEERFTEDELKQVVSILESPVNRKFQSMGADMQRTLAEKLVGEMRPTLEPKFRGLQQGIATRLGGGASAPATGASR